MIKIKKIPAKPFRQSDDWRQRAPMPLSLQVEREHGADVAMIERQAARVFGRRLQSVKGA